MWLPGIVERILGWTAGWVPPRERWVTAEVEALQELGCYLRYCDRQRCPTFLRRSDYAGFPVWAAMPPWARDREFREALEARGYAVMPDWATALIAIKAGIPAVHYGHDLWLPTWVIANVDHSRRLARISATEGRALCALHALRCLGAP